MANASQLFKDDEQDRLGNGYTPNDDSLRNITDINKGEESGYDSNARSGAAEDIANREKTAANDTGNQGGGKSTSAAGLASAEALGGGLAAINPALGAMKGGKILSAFWGNKKRKRNTIGGGVAGLIVTGVMFFLGIASGPLQLIHLAEVLGKSFTYSENSSSVRTGDLLRYAKSGNYGETRLSFLGSKIYGNTVDQLKGLGVEMNSGSGSHLKNVAIDPNNENLTKKYPEMKKMSNKAKINFLADKLGIPETDLQPIGGGKLGVTTRNYGVKATRLLLKNTMSLTDDGKILSAIKFRELAKFYDIPSLFHPMKKLTAAAEKKLASVVDRRIAENARQTEIEKPVRTKINTLKSALDEKIGGTKAKIGGALLITGTTCMVKGAADTIVTYNNAAVLAPSIIKATSAIALGSQIKSGQEVTSSQIGSVVESFQGSDGTIWQGEALQVLASNSQTGTDMPSSYKQLYSNSTTADSIKAALNTPILNTLCSGPGLLLQFVGGVALLTLGPETGGLSDAAIAGMKLAASTAGSILVVKSVVSLIETSDVVPTVLSGTLGGNILAYGARAASGLDARSNGGVELTPAQTALIDKQNQVDSQNNFSAKSLFAKIFDIKDYRSLSGRLIDSVKPGFQQNIASILGSFTHLGSLITKEFSSLLSKAGAASKPYDWGFPQYGIPPEILNTTAYEDPYANAAVVSNLLNPSLDTNNPKHDQSQSYITRAAACFGVAILKTPNDSGVPVWDVSSVNEVYSTDQSYTDANCNNTSDPNWVRIMLFVFDTKTMKAAACYSGDSQSCQELGQGN